MKTTAPANVIGVVFNSEKTAVLLIQKGNLPMWALPGSSIDIKEPPQDAVVKEILKKTGLTVKADRLVGIYTPINRLACKTKLYECIAIKGDLSTSAFFPIENLPPCCRHIMNGFMMH